MIDIHSHLLPGIDDGSENLNVSLQMARDAVADGVTHALMTPHHMNGRYVNHASDVIKLTADFQTELNNANIPLTVFPSQEVRINGGLLSALDDGDILTTDEQGTYILIEFPSDDVPAFTMDMLFQIQQRGLVPIIVHPERNTRLMKEPQLLNDMVSRGAYAQVTASSYVGTFGKAVTAFSEDIIANGLAHLFASDAHHIPGRKYNMRAAFDKLTKQYGQSMVNEFDNNARALVNGEPLVRWHETPIKKKVFFSAY
ncbi:tyrosine-protein phosphatase [Weissella confusa]|uniref:tyrosine-protein phosphatase n=1 Tax=Weissella confusa TaxID=1583 RepID=UPI00223A6943|nr:CpsB/CapC family capsule biosynthesis tyrosine phosphatase [Weissella confusa]MCT0006670.1 tyrosine protein phosphatase [Weissella confusa]MCT0019685.1 tyrosine protein phosphatase [Weissella confusa]MCT0039731.1 tyrosine protein phosphatase [Weissella confusa]